jgi:hypothetical protein
VLDTSLAASYSGLSNTGWTPPDTSVAAGPNHIVEVVNESLAIYSKSSGAKLSGETLASFFSGFVSGSYGFFDPSVVYDEAASRFVIVAQVDDSTNKKGYVDIAVSNSSDPTQGFAEVHQIAVDEGGTVEPDNGKLGMNADAYVFTSNQFTFAGSYDHELVLTIDKNSVLDQNNSTLTDYLVDRSGNFSMIPARMHGSASGGPMWFVETSDYGGSSVDVVKMTNVDTASPSFTDYNLSVNGYSYVSPTQPGGTIDAGDTRTQNAEWNNNYLVGGYNSSSGSDAAAAWLLVNTSGSSPTVSQQGVIHPGSGVSTYFGAVAVDSGGDLGMTYMESSSTEDPSVYITGRMASDPANTMEPATLVKAGAGALSPNRAGDYAGISLDPSTSQTFWADNEYAQSSGAWGTWQAQFSITSGGTDAAPTVANAAAASPSTVTGTTTNLSALGADDDGESGLTYNWATTIQPTGAGAPTFSTNGTNAAKNSVVTIYAAGNYTFQVTITDPSSLTVTSSVSVIVNQTATSIIVSPSSVTLAPLGTQQFAASQVDQFGNAMATQPAFTWSVPSGGIGGIISALGLYTAPSGTGTDTVKAMAGSMNGKATVTVSSIPSAPTNLTATAASKTRVNLAWQESSGGVTGFKIQRSSNGGSTWTLIATTGNVLSYVDTTVHRNSTYEYRVAAYNAAGTSGWSNIATVTTPKAPQLIHPISSYPPPDFPLYINPEHLRRWQYWHRHQEEADRPTRAEVHRPVQHAQTWPAIPPWYRGA